MADCVTRVWLDRQRSQRAQRNAWGFAGATAAAFALGTSSVGMFAGAETEEPSVPEVTAPSMGREVTTWKAYKDTMKIFSGNANPELAGEIGALLGRKLGRMKVGRFADGEVNVQVYETVRGKDIYIVQPTCKPVNEHLMELFLMVRLRPAPPPPPPFPFASISLLFFSRSHARVGCVDDAQVSTMRRASARKITCVIPYYGYARQDRKMTARVPISAADVARLLESMGADRVRGVVVQRCRVPVSMPLHRSSARLRSPRLWLSTFTVGRSRASLVHVCPWTTWMPV